ncbi:DUF1364 domain-containing protein [Paraburkholderia sp. JPY303]|uniref:nuclease domain-containing protein n=1 Tax=Paraburkholderia atlantica TaxID=2654982 RepID=UPI0015916E03|nr:nuclease domain-containing protein [Paraburkholderia atlantica]NUY33274.1 DUF1364 domain-containing protein [Paraburkholderia atlantica]
MTARLIGMGKIKTYRNQKIRDSARGKECLMKLPGCCGGTESTIWSHYRGEAGGKGMSLKADDLCGAYACTHCDAIYDGQKMIPNGIERVDVWLAWHNAHIQSIVILHADGVLK